MASSFQQADQLLHKLAAECKKVLGGKLVGFYVHGSLSLGGFRWEKSDLDIIMVTATALSPAERHRLLEKIVAADASGPAKGLEISVMTEENCRRFSYPTPYELHWSRAWRDCWEHDPDVMTRERERFDSDLAAHITVARQAGFAIYGPQPKELFAEVPAEVFMDSIYRDIQDGKRGIQDDPVYFTLNLCRVLAYVKEGRVIGKEEAGKWALGHVPRKFWPFIEAALQTQLGEGRMDMSAASLDDYYDGMNDLILESGLRRSLREDLVLV